MPADTIVESPDIPVLYVAGNRSRPISEQAPQAIDKLESMMPSLVGRRFFGVVVDGEYRACVEKNPDIDPGELSSSPEFMIPGGRYVHRRLIDWEHNVELLVQAVEELTARSDHDPSRYVVEHYRSHTEVVIRAPVI